MFVIDTAEGLAAVGGGIMCKVAFSGISCTGPADKWGEVAFRAFDTLQGWGGDLGIAIYDWTH